MEDHMATEKKFASQADLEEKKVSFDKLSDNAYASTRRRVTRTPASSSAMTALC
jgi:hypothetical protein